MCVAMTLSWCVTSAVWKLAVMVAIPAVWPAKTVAEPLPSTATDASLELYVQ